MKEGVLQVYFEVLLELFLEVLEWVLEVPQRR